MTINGREMADILAERRLQEAPRIEREHQERLAEQEKKLRTKRLKEIEDCLKLAKLDKNWQIHLVEAKNLINKELGVFEEVPVEVVLDND